MRFHRFASWIVLGFLLTGFATAMSAAVEPPREKFLAAFARSDGGPASISPDGKHVAFFHRTGSEGAVYIVDLASAQAVFHAVVGKEENSRTVGETTVTDPLALTFLQWADNRRVVVATTSNAFLVIDHVARTGRHLLLWDDEVLSLVNAVNPPLEMSVTARRRGRIIAVLPGEPPSVVIEGTFPGRDDQLVLKVNLETGKVEASEREEIAGELIYDSDGQVRAYRRLGFVVDPVFLLKREGRKRSWQPLDKLFPEAASPHSPLKGDAYFGERAFPVAFAGDLLYFASNVGRDTFGLYALNVSTGQRTPLAIEDRIFDFAPLTTPPSASVVVDRVSRKPIGIRVDAVQRRTYWLDPDLAALQATLERRMRGSSVTMVNWDDAREQFVLEVHTRADPGAHVLYVRSTDKLTLLVSDHSIRPPTKATSTPWAVQRPDGSHLSGWLTLPDMPTSAAKRPVIVRLSSPAQWFGVTHSTHAQVIAFSQMGYAVLEVNHRGISGLGRTHLTAGRYHMDQVATEDIVAALDMLAPKAGLDLKRVALFGTHFGSYLALRALQLQPDRFACAVTIEPAVDLSRWVRLRSETAYAVFEEQANRWFFGTEKAELLAASPINDPKTIRAPVFMAANPNLYSYGWSDPEGFRRKLTAAGNPPTFVEITAGVNVPGAEQARLWGKIEDFLGQHLSGH